MASITSYGTIGNSFYELEPTFADSLEQREWKQGLGVLDPYVPVDAPRAEREPHEKPTWIKWLDQKLEQGRPVLYVAFGSQVDISPQQLREIAIGLKESRWEGLKNMVEELMEGEMGKEVRKNVEEYGELARKAMEVGSGSSWRNLDALVNDLTCAIQGRR
ncbi:hypothetical protein OIU77_015218 [Salix suchowensis]|uniref:Uncharacterized protein n=1 Tax=Salix suchowensis TaxID=1278906 RepID=A0ABQ8ZS11_9ROSI|nr:hypothetical protein OIU77_015218 [Salix suchowensis]